MSENTSPESNPASRRCSACDREVPEGAFCGACGAHLAHGETRPGRLHAFAANPAEHVLHPALVSTLLPHLPHRRTAPFRVALIAVALALAAAGLFQLTAPAIALAAAAVPLLYLVYLYEVEVYEDEPWLVVGVTFVLSAVIGGLWAWKVSPIATSDALGAAAFGPSASSVVAAAGLAVAAQLLMLAGPAVLYMLRRRYDEALDGFTFGVAAALGFTLASTLVELAPELAGGPLSSIPAATNALEIAQRGLLIPVINASTTGLVAAALWLRRGRTSDISRNHVAGLPTALVVALVGQAALAASAVLTLEPAILVAIYGIVAVGLLLLVRVALHWMLLAEAVDVEIGPESACPHCHHVVPEMAFCPACGVARRANPKSGAGRGGRGTR